MITSFLAVAVAGTAGAQVPPAVRSSAIPLDIRRGTLALEASLAKDVELLRGVRDDMKRRDAPGDLITQADEMVRKAEADLANYRQMLFNPPFKKRIKTIADVQQTIARSDRLLAETDKAIADANKARVAAQEVEAELRARQQKPAGK